MKLPVLLLLLVATACHVDTSKSTEHSDKPRVDSDKFGIPSILSDADSLEIRVWYSYSFVDHTPMVSMRLSKTGEWSGRLYMTVWNFDGPRPKVQETKVKDIRPKTGWPNFYKSLEALQILSISDMDPRDGGLDGSSYTFEIEKDGSYWSYSYWAPEVLQDRNPHARNVVQILNIIESELGVPWGMQNDKQREAFWTMALDSTLTLYQ